MQDAMLKNDIISALEWEPDIDFGTAGVSVIEGLVTLFGRVGTMPQRDAVERAVLRVRGVATVTNEIEVAANALAGTKAGNGGASGARSSPAALLLFSPSAGQTGSATLRRRRVCESSAILCASRRAC